MMAQGDLFLRSDDSSAEDLEDVLKRHLPWIAERVRLRLGPGLRAKAETQDFVQTALLKVLQYGPRVRLGDERVFRALLARVVENVIRDEHRWFAARRRAMSREQPLPGDSAISLDPPRAEIRRPSQIAGDRELTDWLGLGLELVDFDDRAVLHLRQWEGLSFPEIGLRFQISEDAARMRYGRALARLTSCIDRLRSGRIDEVLGTSQARGLEDDS